MWWFGKSWGAAICDVETWRPTPIGDSCTYCELPIREDDAGFILPHVVGAPTYPETLTEMRPQHRLCMFQQLFGNERAYEMETRLNGTLGQGQRT